MTLKRPTIRISDQWRYLSLVVLLFLAALTCSARDTVTGKVVDASDGSPIPGANVMVKSVEGRMLGYSSTNAEGRFSIILNNGAKGAVLSVTMLGMKPYSATVETVSAPLLIKLEESALQLKEVVVKADRIRQSGDTVTYNVATFAQRQDHTIGDVLRRMPGIDVADNGKIQYQGVDINKFYIEGNDLLGGKYGVATNGISHDDIGAVEILENHQPMQVLHGLSFSDRAAINLKMKNSSRATILVHGNIGGGWSSEPRGALWQGDLFSMMVAGRYQMITTLKGNNTGEGLSDQLIDFTSDAPDEELRGYLSVSAPSTPSLRRNRTYMNRSWMFSSTHLVKTARGDGFRAQVDYHNDRATARGTSQTTYLLESGDRVILEDKSSLSHRNALTGRFSYEINDKTYFLNNTLSADLSWNDLSLTTGGTLPNTQHTRMPEYTVSNRLKLVRRFGNRLVTFNSHNQWSSLPQNLRVENGGKEYGQRIRQHSFYTDERASLGFSFSGALLSLNAGVSGYLRGLDTGMWGVAPPGMTTAGELTTDYLRLFAAPKLEWGYRKLELTLNVPVNLYTYFFSGALPNRTETFISPSLSARFRVTPRMSLGVGASARRSPASLHDIHETSILSDYRSFRAGIDDYYTSSGQLLTASCNYRNVQKGVFLTARGTYRWNHSKFGTVQDIEGDYIFYSYTPRPSDSRTATALLNASKTLDFIRGGVAFMGSYNRRYNNIVSQGVPTDYRGDSWSLSPSVNGNLSSFLNWDLRFSWYRSSMDISSMAGRSSDRFVYSGSVTVTPCDLITWTSGGEFYRNQLEDGSYKGMLMLDTKLTFNLGKRIELSASLTNILNRKSYSYTTYGTVAQYERSSQLRGREFLVSIYLKK